VTDVPDWTTQIVSAPTPLGTLTIPSGKSGSNTLSVNIQNHWTGLVVYLVGPVANYPTSATAALNLAIDLYDNAGNLIGAQAALAIPLVPVPLQLIVPLAGNIDGAVDQVKISAALQLYPGPGTTPTMTATTVVGHVGALLGTGLQWVATPPAQALLVNPEAAAAGVQQQNTANSGPGSNVLQGSRDNALGAGIILTVPPGRMWKGSIQVGVVGSVAGTQYFAYVTNPAQRLCTAATIGAAVSISSMSDIYVWGGVSGAALSLGSFNSPPNYWAICVGQLVF